MEKKFTLPMPTVTALGTAATATAVPIVNSWPDISEFEDVLKANTRQWPVTLDLPNELNAWVGKITTHWALVEWMQSGTVARIMNIGRKEARVMLGDRIGNCMSKIKQNLDIKGFAIPPEFLHLSGLLTKCESARNLLGHGVWLVDDSTGELCIQNPSGEWKQRHPPVSKRKYPEAFYLTQEWLTSTLDDINKAIKDLQALDRHLDTVLPPYTDR